MPRIRESITFFKPAFSLLPRESSLANALPNRSSWLDGILNFISLLFCGAVNADDWHAAATDKRAVSLGKETIVSVGVADNNILRGVCCGYRQSSLSYRVIVLLSCSLLLPYCGKSWHAILNEMFFVNRVGVKMRHVLVRTNWRGQSARQPTARGAAREDGRIFVTRGTRDIIHRHRSIPHRSYRSQIEASHKIFFG